MKKFQPYLHNRKFTVYTDHGSLRWLMNVEDATGGLARWSLLLQQYDFIALESKMAMQTVCLDVLTKLVNEVHFNATIHKLQRLVSYRGVILS